VNYIAKCSGFYQKPYSGTYKILVERMPT